MDLNRTIGLKPYRKNQLLYVDSFKKNCWMVAFLAITEIFLNCLCLETEKKPIEG